MVPEDIPVLREMYQRAGYEYEFPNLNSHLFEEIQVLVNDDGAPIMAAAAERIIQLYLFCGESFKHPAARLYGIQLLHDALAKSLKRKGYREANAFLPPEIEKTFGKRLRKTFGWTKNWLSYAVRIP